MRATADHVVVLEAGRAVDHGPAPDVLGTGGHRPRPGPATLRHRATRDLLAAEHPTVPGKETGVAPRPPDGRGVAATGVVVRRRRTGDPLPGPVSMEFAPCSRTALLCPSGSGKTTFARVLAGLTTPTRGEVRYAGRPLPHRVDRRTTAERRVVHYVHQSSANSFETHRPVLDQLADTARLLCGADPARARAGATEAAGLLGLDEALLHRTPDRLSGGQLQRCALVRALTAHPALLVCDEVTSALDAVSRQRVLDALPRLLAPAGTAPCCSSATTCPRCVPRPRRPYSWRADAACDAVRSGTYCPPCERRRRPAAGNAHRRADRVGDAALGGARRGNGVHAARFASRRRKPDASVRGTVHMRGSSG
ncbi:ATP-binding cassette domain-containing protein [Streptomyces sp. NPDC058534]|uniref:ATP-binding cassette domain-containing protein n=1 Tax=Streptomyces sp. NPDC058534 TaxID=3346541 RepID=UPI00364BBAA9